MAGAIASPAIARTEQSPTIVKINYIPDGWVRMEKMTTANHTHYLTTAQIPPHTHTWTALNG